MNVFLIAFQWWSDKVSDAWQDIKHPSWTKCPYLDCISANLILTENTKFGLCMEDDPAEKSSCIFFPLLIAPSNLLDLVYPVVEETAVCETYGRNPMEKKSAREMKQPCQHITITWLLRKSQPFSASFQTQTKYVLILTVSCIIMDLIFFLN